MLCFEILRNKGHISEGELRFFTYEYKKNCNLGKLYLSPKFYKDSMVFQEGQSSQIVRSLLEKCLDFYITISNRLCKMVSYIKHFWALSQERSKVLVKFPKMSC